MPEPLKKEQPSSSVATILLTDVARRAINPERPQAPRPTPAQEIPEPEPRVTRPEPRPAAPTQPTGEPADVMRQFQLTPAADATLRRVMRAYSESSGVDLNRSEFLRAVLHVLEHSIPQHERAARSLGTLRRPKNDPWQLHKRDELERRLARAIQEAFRSAPPME